MELDKNCNNLNNIESLESDLSAAQTLDSNLNSFISVERRYAGVESDNISVEVDQKAKTISATLKQNKFASKEEFPEIGSDRQIYVDLSNKSLWVYDTENSEYVSVGGISGDKPTFESIQALVTRLNDATADDINQGESLYVLTTNVPDFWVYKVVENKVEYAYTTDADLVSQIKTNGFVQIGHYQISILETEKITVDSELSETSTNPVQNKVIYSLINNINSGFNQIAEDVENIKTNKQDKLTAGENITIDENNVISAAGGSGGGLTIADLPKFTNKIYINMANATALNGLMSLPCVESSNFVVTFPDGTSQEYIEPTTLIEHQFADANQEGWVYVYGDWKGVGFQSAATEDIRKILTKVIYDYNISELPNYALAKCSELREIYLPAVSVLGEYSLFGTELFSLSLPEITNIKDDALYSLSYLSKLELGEKLNFIGRWAGYNCHDLKEVYIPKLVQSVSVNCFNAARKVHILRDYPFSIESTAFGSATILVPYTKLRDFKVATNWTKKADKIYPEGGNYSETITIPSAAWDTATNTATVEAVGATSEARNVITWFTSSGGSQVENTYGLKCTAQGTMQLTFSCETIPTEDVEVSVSYMLTNYA